MADNGSQPATKADLQELRQELRAETKADLQALELRIAERLDASESRMREHMEAIETHLLTAFHGWASPMAARVSSLETTHLTRLSSLEERMMAVERRLNFPPHGGSESHQ